jgi:hypothetical protein
LGPHHQGFFSSLRQIARPAEGTTRWMLQSADEELAWLIILATIPVGLPGWCLSTCSG